MFRLEVPESAIIQPENVDPNNELDLVPRNVYKPKPNTSQGSEKKSRKDLTTAPKHETESWIYGNILPEWIVGFENITQDAWEIDGSYLTQESK